MSRSSPVLWLVAAIVVGALAVACGVAAFTRFDRGTPPEDGSPEVREWNKQLYQDARESMGFGIATAILLWGCFACGQRWAMRNSQPTAGEGPEKPSSPSKRS